MALRDWPSNVCDWLVKSGEPYATVRGLVRRAEADSEQRHVANLIVASRTKPRYSAWLLERAPSPQKAWRDQVASLVGESTFNLS
jgi:hypothetical protein